jgi:hypothetical protein
MVQLSVLHLSLKELVYNVGARINIKSIYLNFKIAPPMYIKYIPVSKLIE